MSSLVINIKGRDWKFLLMPDKRFNKIHNPDEDGNAAMTVPSTYEVHFRKSDWNVATVRHELLHVLFNMSLVGSADLSTTDVQEICAEIVAEHAIEIVLWADRISEKFIGGQ